VVGRRARPWPHNGQQHVRNEITLSRRLKHKNLINLMDVFYNVHKEKIYLVRIRAQFVVCGCSLLSAGV
jgi:hypothetical protein